MAARPLMLIPCPVMEVAAAVIVNRQRQVLIARRADHLHQGSCWEFPGGKLEPGETPHEALVRELREELGIAVEQAMPLLTLRHDYPDRRVRLHVWRVERFAGVAHGQQGQPLRWVSPDELPGFRFPAANRPIVAAARLPARYAILETPDGDAAALMNRLAEYAQRGITLMRLRGSRLDPDRYAALAREAVRFCASRGIALLLNGPPEQVLAVGAAGLHLRSDELMKLDERPLDRRQWVAASCHDEAQLQQAARIGADFAVFGPVLRTATHPEARPLGWAAFGQSVEAAELPVYALGGLDESHLSEARHMGAQGIAAIRGFQGRMAP